jgi:hypothetical protein
VMFTFLSYVNFFSYFLRLLRLFPTLLSHPFHLLPLLTSILFLFSSFLNLHVIFILSSSYFPFFLYFRLLL